MGIGWIIAVVALGGVVGVCAGLILHYSGSDDALSLIDDEDTNEPDQ